MPTTAANKALYASTPQLAQFASLIVTVAWWGKQEFRWEYFDLDDLQQEIARKLLSTVCPPNVDNPKAWAYTIARNHVRRLYRDQQDIHVSVDSLSEDMTVFVGRHYDAVLTDGGIEAAETRVIWAEFLDTLTIRERYVFWYRFMGYTFPEIASRMTDVIASQLAHKYGKMREEEVLHNIPIFKGTIRHMRFSEKQARDTWAIALGKMEAFAEERMLETWLSYIRKETA